MREMKDSGVEWIGEIPIDWEISSFKRVFSFDKGLPITKENLVESGIPVLSYGQIHSKNNSGIRLSDDLLRYVREDFLTTNPSSLAKQGDILFADTSEDYDGIGNCAYISTDTPIFAGYHTIITRPKDIGNPQYLAFQFQTDNWRSQLRGSASGIKVFTISQSMLKETTVIIPSSQTQHRIAAYLDAKCAQIDRAIARQQEVIEKLKEYKLSVITEAVTKGLNPDVPMKDSGIEWIGKIPKQWEVSALKNYIDVLPGYAFSSLDFDTENGIPLLRGVNVTPSGLRWDDVVYWNKSITSELEPFMLCKNDIVFGLDRPWINEGTRITIISENDLPCLLLQRVCRIRSTRDLDFRIIYYWLGSSMFQDIVSLATTGVSVPHISTRQIGNFIIAVPPEAEQKYICEYLDRKFSKIDIVLNQKNELISKLTEYKKSLIYEVVTGKREV